MSWEVQLWSSVLGTASVGTGLGAVPEGTASQDGAGMVPFLPSVSSAWLCCHGSPCPGEGAAQPAVPAARWVVILALHCSQSPVHGPRTLLFYLLNSFLNDFQGFLQKMIFQGSFLTRSALVSAVKSDTS